MESGGACHYAGLQCRPDDAHIPHGIARQGYGQAAHILAASPEKMHAPLEIDKELYIESYYDTASLLYVLKNRVLDEVGYNYSGICVQLRQEQEEAQKQSPRMDEMTL